MASDILTTIVPGNAELVQYVPSRKMEITTLTPDDAIVLLVMVYAKAVQANVMRTDIKRG